jgi:hypothetical protein
MKRQTTTTEAASLKPAARSGTVVEFLAQERIFLRGEMRSAIDLADDAERTRRLQELMVVDEALRRVIGWLSSGGGEP